jgi:hypothetical protein
MMVPLGLILIAAAFSPGHAVADSGSSAGVSASPGTLDCNGFSPLQPGIPWARCPEIAPRGGERFEDNGHYVGHDEPVISFYSNKPGSGYAQQYEVTLPVDPDEPASASFSGPVWSWQLSPAFWFGVTMCDNESYPEGTKVCVPDSDSNIQVPPRADHAGTAYTELQFYAPDRRGAPSCHTRYCVALTITGVQANLDFSVRNDNCIQPQAFAYLTHSGRPIGPVGPDNQDVHTFAPTPDVLMMNPGDQLRISMYDTPGGYTTLVEDLSTGESGAMVASANNGWRHILWDPVNFSCQGAPYTYHPMYATAAPPLKNGQPRTWPVWSAHTYNVAYDVEIGHFEPVEEPHDDDDVFCQNRPVPGCFGDDTDFDGFSYHPDWPDGSPKHPTPFSLSSPLSRSGSGPWNQTYERVNFETDLPAIEFACDVFTGRNCTNPPKGAEFYPWTHLIPGPGGTGCAWTIGDDLPNQLSNFGGERRAWGHLLLTDGGGGFIAYLNFATEPIANPCP